jgi:hypothetical protein
LIPQQIEKVLFAGVFGSAGRNARPASRTNLARTAQNGPKMGETVALNCDRSRLI